MTHAAPGQPLSPSDPPLKLTSSAPEPDAPETGDDVAVYQPSPAERRSPARLSFMDKVEAYIARLSTKNTFWHRLCSMIWLPYAFKSGIRMKKVDESTFSAVLPFRRFNRNWYNAMAGAALLANSEIAGGMYVFGFTGGAYTIVCKHLEYSFLRPCFGPAIYTVIPREDLAALIATGKEFNVTCDLEITQQALVPKAVAKLKKKDMLLAKMASRARRVGKCVATFHVTPTIHQKTKRGDVRKVGGK